jgi:hypothetical protein
MINEDVLEKYFQPLQQMVGSLVGQIGNLQQQVGNLKDQFDEIQRCRPPLSEVGPSVTAESSDDNISVYVKRVPEKIADYLSADEGSGPLPITHEVN